MAVMVGHVRSVHVTLEVVVHCSHLASIHAIRLDGIEDVPASHHPQLIVPFRLSIDNHYTKSIWYVTRPTLFILCLVLGKLLCSALFGLVIIIVIIALFILAELR